MTADEYMGSRLEDQIKWYDSKSQWNQQWYNRLRISEIILASTVPFIAGYASISSLAQVAVGLAGVMVAVIAGATSLFKLQENWIHYRTTSESLKHEKFLYLTGSIPYGGADDFLLLVERSEALFSKENTAWSCYAGRDRTKEPCKT